MLAISPSSKTLAAALFLASIAAVPALAQSQPPSRPETIAPAAGPYSGQADAAAKQGPEGCQSPAGAAQAKTPEQLAKALDASKASPYDNKADSAAKDAIATCGQ